MVISSKFQSILTFLSILTYFGRQITCSPICRGFHPRSFILVYFSCENVMYVTMYRRVYYLVTSMSKRSIEISLYSIVDPNTGLETEQNVWSTKNVTRWVSEYSSSRDLSMSTVGDSENLKSNLTFLKTTLSQHLLIFLSIFDSWGHMRALCPRKWHPGGNAPISSRYYAL